VSGSGISWAICKSAPFSNTHKVAVERLLVCACVQFQYMPPVDSRSCAGFVGLKNGGATCYMNSLLQQLYMISGIPESILSIDDELVSEERLFIDHVSFYLNRC